MTAQTTPDPRSRVVEIDDALAAIRTQIAAADLQRQATGKPIDARWFHRAKTALRHLQRERAGLVRHVSPRREALKDCLIAVLRERHDEATWSTLVAEAHRRAEGGGAVMVALPKAATPTLLAIYEAYEARHRGDFRDHLGASLSGKPCERALWYDFRWVTLLQFPGRILRLFETGQMEEARLVRNLRATGATVLEVDPETGRQWRVEAHGGHFGGSLDAVAVGLREAPKAWHVVEFKTHSAKSFRDLVGKGVAISKPRHWAQVQIYMHLTDLSRALYVAVCKDTDALHVERVRADHDIGRGLLDKARRVIEAKRPPSRISEDQNSYECRFCEHRAVCHEGAAAEHNCRTCLHSTPVEGGWHCARFAQGIDGAAQRAGCGKHLFIPDLVPGKVTDVGDDYVVYRMADGTEWVNGARDGVPC